MTKEQEIGPGAEVLSLCGKCKLPLAHTVVAMKKNGTIGKCECKTCGALHLYRDPDKPKKTRVSQKNAKVESPTQMWMKAMAGSPEVSKAYAMTEEFVAGEIVAHPSFGKGIVTELISPNKIRTVFECSEKLLIHKQS